MSGLHAEQTHGKGKEPESLAPATNCSSPEGPVSQPHKAHWPSWSHRPTNIREEQSLHGTPRQRTRTKCPIALKLKQWPENGVHTCTAFHKVLLLRMNGKTPSMEEQLGRGCGVRSTSCQAGSQTQAKAFLVFSFVQWRLVMELS